MVNKLSADNRCPHCLMMKDLCICAEAAELKNSLDIATHVRCIIHHKEIRKPTNTGRLAAMTMPNAKSIVRGLYPDPVDWSCILDECPNPILLHPSENSIELNSETVKNLSNPCTLVLTDGNWRQAAKMPQRIEVLQKIPHYHLALDRPSQYQLRREHREFGLSTFEALVEALKLLEGEKVYTPLFHFFELMVKQCLTARKGY